VHLPLELAHLTIQCFDLREDVAGGVGRTDLGSPSRSDGVSERLRRRQRGERLWSAFVEAHMNR
jgi:hypothetical protein